MWKRPDQEHSHEPVPAKLNAPFDAPKAGGRSERPAVGSKTCFKGDISGEEDLVIEGKVEGRIDLKAHTVTIGKTGWVKGDIYANVINVEGELIGDVFAGEKVMVYRTGNIRGNLTAPRVSLEDGAKLKGVIDMEPNTVMSTDILSSAVTEVSAAEHSVSELQSSADEGDASGIRSTSWSN